MPTKRAAYHDKVTSSLPHTHTPNLFLPLSSTAERTGSEPVIQVSEGVVDVR